jgi:hypothetical protein
MGILKGENKEGGERERWQQKQRRFRTEEDERGRGGLGSDYDTSISPWLAVRYPLLSLPVVVGGDWGGAAQACLNGPPG